jgi:DNA-binding MarR family transcriptional regulator
LSINPLRIRKRLFKPCWPIGKPHPSRRQHRLPTPKLSLWKCLCLTSQIIMLLLDLSNKFGEQGILMFRPNLKVLKVFRMGMAYANRQLKDIDISAGLVYFIIELSQVEWLNMSDLSAAVGVDNAYATRAVEKLSALGYVRKVPDEQDRRAYRISLTPSGRKIAERVNRTMQQWVGIITAGVSLKDLLTVNRVFDRFHQNAVHSLEKGDQP